MNKWCLIALSKNIDVYKRMSRYRPNSQTGSGYDFLTKERDISWEGSEKQMNSLKSTFKKNFGKSIRFEMIEV